jgi:hypothetical protein
VVGFYLLPCKIFPPDVELHVEEVIVLDGKARIELRNKLLQELYDIYFEKNGSGKKYSNEDLRSDSETNLAYEYLKEKNLLDKRFPGGRVTEFIITAHGIDEIEKIS